MKKENIKPYVQALLNDLDVDESLACVPDIVALLVVYKAGLERKDFPLDKLMSSELAEPLEEIPAPFHSLVLQGAILRSKRGNDYVWKTVKTLAEEFKYFFIKN